MQGWECPKCGRCYSPYTSECTHCGPSVDFNFPNWGGLDNATNQGCGNDSCFCDGSCYNDRPKGM